MINYEILFHETTGDKTYTCLKSLNNPVFYEHIWSETEKLNESGTMAEIVANLNYLDMIYVEPIPDVTYVPLPVINIAYAQSIPINLIDVSILIDTLVYPLWIIGKNYILNEKLTYDNVHYKVAQAHKSQADWLPNLLPNLYTPISAPNVIPNWVQPTGAQDAYNIGDHVMFNGHEYSSLINANVWSPVAYPAGWELIA